MQSSGTGIRVGAYETVISQCTISLCKDSAIAIPSAYNATISDSTIENNEKDGITVGSGAFAVLRNVVVSKNKGHGVSAKGADIDPQDTRFFGNQQCGVYTESSGVMSERDTFNQNVWEGFVSFGDGNQIITLKQTVASKNGASGIVVSDVSITLRNSQLESNVGAGIEFQAYSNRPGVTFNLGTSASDPGGNVLQSLVGANKGGGVLNNVSGIAVQAWGNQWGHCPVTSNPQCGANSNTCGTGAVTTGSSCTIAP